MVCTPVMFLNLRIALFTLHKYSSQNNKFVHLLRGSKNLFLQHTKGTPRSNNVILGLGIIPFVPKVSAESELNINKDEKIAAVNNTTDEEPNKVEKTGWERLCAIYEME